MKKVKYLVFLMAVLFGGVAFVNAAPYFSYSTSKSTVIVGNTVKITVKLNGAGSAKGKAGAWSYCIDYDETVFSLSSSSSRTQGSKACIMDGAYGVTSTSETFTFKAKKSGSSTFTVTKASVSDYDTELPMTFSKGSVTVKAKTQAEIEASYSTNANLSALRVVDHVISPDFDKDKLEYNLEVENDVENIEIKATRADSSASVSGTGVKNLSEGLNKFNIVVTAEKGNKKTYVINVTRKELNPINVDVDGFNYTVVRKADALEAPTYYSSTEIEINGEKVPAFSSDITGYTLVGLKDEEGNIDLYSYTDTGYKLYKQVGTEGLVFIPGNNDKLITGYEQSKNITINNTNVKGYVNDNKKDYVLVYGMNAATGESRWYMYDTIEGTFQRYEEYVIEEKEEKNIYFILTIIFGGIAGLVLVVVILLISKNSKIRKKNEKLITMLQALREAKKEKDTFVDKSKEEAKKEEKKKVLQDELRKKQEEFMDTGENEIIEDDVDLEDVTPVKKSKKK